MTQHVRAEFSAHGKAFIAFLAREGLDIRVAPDEMESGQKYVKSIRRFMNGNEFCRTCVRAGCVRWRCCRLPRSSDTETKHSPHAVLGGAAEA